MRNLTSLDTFFLAAEDGRTVTNISALAIVDADRADGGALTRDDLTQLVGERLHLLPPLRWTLAEVPFGVGLPSWVDSEVDLDFHIREIALPSPGSRHQLEEQVARLSAHPLDRSRPLWEIYLIRGLEGHRSAVLTKFHHAAIDGVSGAEIMGILFDGSPEGRALPPTPPHRPERAPGQVEHLARSVAGSLTQPVRVAGATWRTLTHLDHVATVRGIPGTRMAGQTVRRIARTTTGSSQEGDILNTPAHRAPRTPLNGTLSRRRRFAMASLPLGPVKDLKATHGTTVNDVVVALCAGALRSWLGSAAQLPSQPLVAMIPVSVRTERQRGTFGNRVGTMVVPLPTDEADPWARLDRCRDELREAKDRHQAVPASLMQDSTDLVPPVLFGPAARALTRLASTDGLDPVANLVISNVPGSRSPLYCAGAPVLEHYPVSALGDSLGLNITIFSYLDRLHVGLVADRELVSDLTGLAEALTAELDRLLDPQAAPAGKGGR